MAGEFPDDSRRTGPALEKTYRFLFWLMPTVEKFPRSYKFVLGDRIQTVAMDKGLSKPPTPGDGDGRRAATGGEPFRGAGIAMPQTTSTNGEQKKACVIPQMGHMLFLSREHLCWTGGVEGPVHGFPPLTELKPPSPGRLLR